MPGRDRTGPQGQGPVTGRGLGQCTGRNVPWPAGAGRYGYGFGPGRGMGFGWGRRARGAGWGRGWWYDEPVYPTVREEISDIQERLSMLKEEQKWLERRMNDLKKEEGKKEEDI